MHHILTPAARLRAVRERSRLGIREFGAWAGVHPFAINAYERGRAPVAKRVVAMLDEWEAADIGRPVPTVTWTRGNPFKARRKR